MVFSSITFLYLFLPICLTTYYISPQKWKNYVLLFFSLLFYGFETPAFILMMLFCIGLTFVNGLLIDKYRNKLHFIIAIILSLTPLAFFKYTNFFIKNANAILKTQITTLDLILPLGISFYTFQMMTYLVDVWRKDQIVEKNLFNFALYVSFFPQLVAGPILKYSEVQKQILNREENFNKFSEGIFIFTLGLGKKILIANQLGELCALYNPNNTTILMTWLYAIAYSMQLYFDFSGYSTMAIGIGKFFGFELPINFNYPFIATSIRDFWKRWHITLSSFFKNYVYIPMGGSRVSNKRYIFNMFTVWFLTGFWHGADWNFILWGLIFFIALIVEKFIKAEEKISVFIRRLYTLFIVMISFITFGQTNLSTALLTMKNLFVGQLFNEESLFILRNFSGVLIAGLIGSTPLFINCYDKYIKNKKISIILEPIIILSILFISTGYLIDGSFNPFLYFRF